MADAIANMVNAKARLQRVEKEREEDKRAERMAYIGLAGKAVTGIAGARRDQLGREMLSQKTADGLQKYQMKTDGGFGAHIRRSILPMESDFELTGAGKREIKLPDLVKTPKMEYLNAEKSRLMGKTGPLKLDSIKRDVSVAKIPLLEKLSENKLEARKVAPLIPLEGGGGYYSSVTKDVTKGVSDVGSSLKDSVNSKLSELAPKLGVAGQILGAAGTAKRLFTAKDDSERVDAGIDAAILANTAAPYPGARGLSLLASGVKFGYKSLFGRGF